MTEKKGQIEIFGAREHNLKDIDVVIPRHQLVVITGLSGSGKSSLAFDTLFAEGQRRYIESFSAYARQFLGGMKRPDVDKINGLSPVIAIEQKSTGRNPRSTVGTITEIYDFLRLLYARVGEAYSYITGEPMVKYTDEQIHDAILQSFSGQEIQLLSPVVKGRKGHYRELFEKIRKLGFLKVRVDGEVQEIAFGMKLDRYKTHDVEILIDQLTVDTAQHARLRRSTLDALKHGKGYLTVVDATGNTRQFSRFLMCPTSGISYEEPAPNFFSFNSPYGACNHCNGLGEVSEMDLSKIIPDRSLTIKQGAIIPLGPYKKELRIFHQIEALGKHFGFDIQTPVDEMEDEHLQLLLYGSPDIIKVKDSTGVRQNLNYEGIVTFIEQQVNDDASKSILKWAQGFMQQKTCSTCQGTRLRKEARYFRIAGYDITQISAMDIHALADFFNQIEEKLSPTQQRIASEALKEIRKRIGFLLDVGLEYLTLNRTSRTLSGGEAQRIRLATQIGSQLVGVLYILDEPSIGLHQRDNHRLISALKKLRDLGNSVIVVEHDKDMMLESDYIIDMGPGAGVHGGRIVAQGTPDHFLMQNAETARYLSGEKHISIPINRRKGNGSSLSIHNATGHNLKDVTLRLPLGTLICITGVSGSGKSSLINDTLFPALNRMLYTQSEKSALPFRKITGDKHIDKVIRIDQSPIGRTPRSNPATYTGVFSDIRNLFAELPEARIRGYKPGRFSFNVKGGRCETCGGAGIKVVEMNFLPDVEVTCEACNGRRYNRETLEVRYKGKSINDVLNMTIEDALTFFEHIPAIVRKIQVLNQIGLGYLTLGQSSTTLSGGEAQRVKLASELNRTDTGNTLYLLDEPTTGLHFEDVRILLDVLNKLVDKGNTVLVIEHNMDIIKSADWIVDMGPEGGNRGGQILFEGTPEALLSVSDNHTARFMLAEFSEL